MVSERSGIVDIGLEGKMLTGRAFAAAVVATYTGSSLWLGLGAGVVASITGISLIHGYASIDQQRQPDRLGHGDQHGRRAA